MSRNRLLLLALVLTAKLVLARYLCAGMAGVLQWGTVSGLVFAALLVCLAALLPKRLRWPAFFAVDVGLSVVLIAIVVYFRYFGDVPTPAALQLLPELAPLAGTEFRLLQPVYLLFLLDLPLLVWMVLRVPDDAPERAARILAAAGLLLVSFAIPVVVAIIDPLPSPTVSALSRGLVVDVLARAAIGRGRPATDIDPTDAREVQAMIDVVHPGEAKSALAGIAKGRNLIVVQIESMQAFPIGRTLDGKPITPQLDGLAKDGLWFPDFFTQVGHGHTADAEFTVNTSLNALDDAVVALSYADKRFPSLPRLLSSAGYDTMTLHVNRLNYWNRQNFYPALGFGRAYGDTFFGHGDAIGLGSSDDVLFQKAVPVLAAERKAGRRFYAQLVTLSTHDPEYIGRDRIPLKVPERFEGSVIGAYLEGVSYEDAAIGRFVDGLKREGLWEDSVIVFYGDHGILPVPPGGREAALAAEVLGRPYTRADYQNVPLMIVAPGAIEPATVERTAGQVDVLPTLASLLGVPLGPQVHFGKDLLASGTHFLVMSPGIEPGAYADDSVLVEPAGPNGKGEAYSVRTKQPVPLPPTRAAEASASAALELQALDDAYIKALPQR